MCTCSTPHYITSHIAHIARITLFTSLPLPSLPLPSLPFSVSSLPRLFPSHLKGFPHVGGDTVHVDPMGGVYEGYLFNRLFKGVYSIQGVLRVFRGVYMVV